MLLTPKYDKYAKIEDTEINILGVFQMFNPFGVLKFSQSKYNV